MIEDTSTFISQAIVWVILFVDNIVRKYISVTLR